MRCLLRGGITHVFMLCGSRRYPYEIRGPAGAVRSAHPPVARLALAVCLSAQGVLLALHLIAAQVAVDRRRPALPPHHRPALATPGALDALLLDCHFCPLLDRHARIIENLRDGCQAPLFSSWGACVEPLRAGMARLLLRQRDCWGYGQDVKIGHSGTR